MGVLPKAISVSVLQFGFLTSLAQDVFDKKPEGPDMPRNHSNVLSHHDPYGRFMRMPDVENNVGLKKSKIYQLMKDPVDPFPSPIHIGMASVWIENEIVAWKRRYIKRSRP